jgi:hypothetical protein
VSFELGRNAESLARLEEALALIGKNAMAAAYAYQLAWIAENVHRRDEPQRLLALGTESMPAAAAGNAILERNFLQAADIFEQAGSISEAALARLRAAEQFVREGRRVEADEQLAKALAFYRSVGATRCIREGEALLAATA